MESRKMALMNLYFQGRNRNTDVENGLVDKVEEGENQKKGESSINIYTLWSKMDSW